MLDQQADHNLPPPLEERLPQDYARLIAEVEALAARADAAPTIVSDDTDQGHVAEIITSATKISKRIEAVRVDETAPYLLGQRVVMGFFKPLLERLERISAVLKKRGDNYLDAKAEAEKRERERLAAEARERQRLADEQLARTRREQAEAEERIRQAEREAERLRQEAIREAERQRLAEEKRIADEKARREREERERIAREKREAEHRQFLSERQRQQAEERTRLAREEQERKDREAREAEDRRQAQAREAAEKAKRDAEEAERQAERLRQQAIRDAEQAKRDAQQAEAEAQKAERAGLIAQRSVDEKPADMARTRVGATLSTLQTQFDFAIDDLDLVDLNALRPYISRADVDKAVRAFVKINRGSKTLGGVRIFEVTKGQYR